MASARLPPPTNGKDAEFLDGEAADWSLGDLPRLKGMLSTLEQRLAGVTQVSGQQEKNMKGLEDSMLKGESLPFFL